MPLLPDAESFKRIVSGADPSARGRLCRALLGPLGAAWTGVMAARNAAYDAGLLPAHAAPVPVVSVGNLSLGGTGKTPLVAWVVRRLLQAGHLPAIVSRGYGAARGAVSDEAAELALLLPGVPHLANADRVAAARGAARAGARIVVLDDGFQHRRLRRDLDVVAVDATDPFGCGHVFPRGLLRERLAGLSRAQAVILTRCAAVPPERRDEIRAGLAAACAGRVPGVWAEASHAPVRLRDAAGGHEELGWLAGRRVVGFAGIGNPAAFHDTLRTLGARVVAFRAFPDHHAYGPADARALAGLAAEHGGAALVTTLKDLVKIAPPAPAPRLLALEIAIVIERGADELGGLVDAVAEGRR